MSRAQESPADKVAADLIDKAEGSLPASLVIFTAGNLADVEHSVERFIWQERVLRKADRPTPAIMSPASPDDPLPIDIGLPEPAERSLVGASDVDVATALLHYPRQEGFQLVELDSEQAKGTFRRRLTAFLHARLSPPSPSTTGFGFTVSTNTPGLRVHYSKAYFFNPRLVFGGPSTPVAGTLQPGRYTFGAYPPAGGYWDLAEYDIPGPPYSAHLSI